jgi:hypothetical protein
MIAIGERVGSYRVVRAIGSGGMGMVFEAVHEYIRSRAAVKILHTQYSENPEVRARFLTEALATNLVSHPGIVSVFEHGQLDNGGAFIIMEYLEGASLRARISAMGKQGEGHGRGTPPQKQRAAAAPTPPLDRAAALRLLRQLASAMAAAHQKGIIHRDLKPENIMIVKDPFTLGGERVKILDFGIAKVLGPDGVAGRTGGPLGTPAYMAPESWVGAATVNEKVDVYALGMILFETLTGRLPLEDAKDNIVRWQQIHEAEPPLSLRSVDASIPEALDTLTSRLLSKKPQDRPDMAEVAATLEELCGLNLRFRAGGFIREGEFYAKRDADDQLFYALLNGQSCHVLGPRQIGKTSLMHAVSHRLTNVRGPELEGGILCAVLDLLGVESTGARGERFYFELCRELYRGLGLPGTATDFWVEHQARAPRPSERFALLLQQIPAQLEQKAVLFIDHVEVLLRLPLPREEFFAALFAMPPAVPFCLLGTALKEELLPDERHHQFARSRAIPLGDLSQSEVRVFLPGLHALGEASEKALARVFDWTSGHPYLTQRLCETLSTRPLPDGSIQQLVDSVAREVIASNRRREDASFAFAEEGIRRAESLRPALLALYRQILEGPLAAGETAAKEQKEPQALKRLLLLGFIKRGGDELSVRNRIFATVFGAEWLQGEEAVRPLQQPLSLWEGHQRHRDYLLLGPRLSEALAWARGREDLSAEEQAFLNASVELEQANQRRRIGLLFAAVMVLLLSLLGTGLAWRSVRLAKRQVELQHLFTQTALRETERARKEADNARNKSLLALQAAEEARRTAEEARIATEGALHEAAHQRGVALSAKERARVATEKAFFAAHAAQQATENAQEASRRADQANQTADRTLTEKAEAIAVIQGQLQACDKERKGSEATAQRCQQSLDAKEAEAQSLRGNIGTLNAQVGTLSTQLATSNGQLAACRSSESRPPTSSKAQDQAPEAAGAGGPASGGHAPTPPEGPAPKDPAKEPTKE